MSFEVKSIVRNWKLISQTEIDLLIKAKKSKRLFSYINKKIIRKEASCLFSKMK